MDRTILVVDDNRRIVDFLETVLEMEGYIVHAAYSGAECLAYLEKEKPGLVLLDIVMSPMDGWTVLERIREQPGMKKVRVIMLTAKHPTSEEAEKYAPLIDGYILKPFDLRSLKESIRTAFLEQERLSGIVHEACEKGTERSFLEEYCRLSRIVKAQQAFSLLLEQEQDSQKEREETPEAIQLARMKRIIQQVIGIPGSGE
ncbi:MAG: response regulator PleD [Methanoregulaceae archaeon PtaB.Bin056]|jgi:CheY-like chemotaxis protein|nr:MAG: response regulator PleD [Methanoregulaceae archaeon PtaB.Bin056]